MTDSEIIRLYGSGKKEQAFNEIVREYSERLYWIVRRFLYSHEDTDDLLQDIFIKVWTALPSFREDARLFTWLYRIAVNESLNFLRKKRVRSFFSVESYRDLMEQKIDDDPYFNGTELERKLWKAMAGLPNKQRIVFMMRYFDEVRYEQMSEILNTSVGSLKASYHHAYMKIKEELQSEF